MTPLPFEVSYQTDTVTGFRNHMQTLGQRLREEREKLGRSIEELARVTRIRSDYFEAIENDRKEAFPGPFFYRSFLRQYVALLGLPESVIEGEIQQSLDDAQAIDAERSVQAAESRPDLPPLPTGRTDFKIETRRLLARLVTLAAVLAVCSGAYFAWMHWGQRLLQEERTPATASQPVKKAEPHPPQQPAGASPQPVGQTPVTTAAEQPQPGTPAQTPAGTTEPASQLETAQAPARTPAQSPPVAPAQPPAAVSAPAKQATAAPAPSPGTGQGQALPEGDLTVQASEQCWVDGWRDGKRFYGSMLHDGSVVAFSTEGTLRLRFGNAGAITLRLKGKALPEIGPKGQVRSIEIQNGEYHPVGAAEPAPKKQ